MDQGARRRQAMSSGLRFLVQSPRYSMSKSHSGSRWRRRLSATNVLGAIIVVGLVALIVPRGWLSWVRVGGQALLPAQRGAAIILDAVTDPTGALPDAIRAEDYLAMRERQSSLERETASLTQRVQELEEENRVLLASRQSALGTTGVLIPTLLLGEDPAFWRRTAMIDQGSWAGVPLGAPVATRGAVLDRGQADGVRAGSAVLRGEVLLGVITEVGALTSRVQLVSDPRTQIRVRIGERRHGAFTLLETPYWLTGAGDDHMTIADVVRADVESGAIAVGDTVLAQPVESVLPEAMTIGTIEAVEHDLHNPLLSRLRVRSAASFDRVRRVYVFKAE